MKKIINKKLYDTSTATCIAEYSGPARVSDFSFYRETLYRKRTGEILSTARAARGRAMHRMSMG